MRLKLKLFRTAIQKSQDEFCLMINYSRPYYCNVESGKKKGAPKFWKSIKREFSLSDETIEEMKVDYHG